MMAVEPGVVDANILVYAVNSSAPQHDSSRALLEASLDPEVSLYVTSQILCEFYSLITNPKRTVMPWSSTEALHMISELLVPPGLKVLPAPVQAVTGLLELLKSSTVTGSDVFDVQIVATMQANNIHRIYTFNVADFQNFPDVTVVTP